MPEDMPAAGYLSDLLLFVYVAATLAFFAGVVWRRTRSADAPSWSRRLAWTLSFGALLTSAFVAGELYYRYVFDEPNTYQPTLSDRAWYLRHYGPQLNSDGFRDAEWVRKKHGVRRVLLVGGTSVAGIGITDLERRVSAQLERLLGEGNEVLAAGQPDWSLAQSVAWVRENGERLSPDTVVFVMDTSTETMFGAEQPPRYTWWNPARSFLIDRFWHTWIDDHFRAPEALRDDFDSGRRALDDLERTARARIARMPLPWLFDTPPRDDALARYAEGATVFGDLRESTRHLFAAEPRTLRISRTCTHLNATGHELLAEAIEAELSD